MRRLNGWERLSVALTGAWLLYATITYLIALTGTPYANMVLEELVPHYLFEWVPDTSYSPNPNPYGNPMVRPIFSSMGFGAFLLLPPGAAYALYAVARWVRAGFREQA